MQTFSQLVNDTVIAGIFYEFHSRYSPQICVRMFYHRDCQLAKHLIEKFYGVVVTRNILICCNLFKCS